MAHRSFASRLPRQAGALGALAGTLDFLKRRTLVQNEEKSQSNKDFVEWYKRRHKLVANEEPYAGTRKAHVGPPGIRGLNIQQPEGGCAMTPSNTGKAFEPMHEFMLDTKRVLAGKDGASNLGGELLGQRIYAPNEVTAPTKTPDHQPSTYYDAKSLPRPEWRPLPTFSLDEIEKHTDKNPNSCWVTYRGGVYDMTEFLDCHPGGEGRIRMVAGNDLEAFWKVYSLHDRPHIQNLIEHYRIGNLSEEDAKTATENSHFANYYDTDPRRSSAVASGVRIPSVHPWNHEPQRKHLVESFFTPNELFFIRNHNNVPDIDTSEWTLEIEGNEKCGLKDTSFTYEDLKTKFPRHEVIAVLQCAGNRQEDYVTEDQPLYVAPH